MSRFCVKCGTVLKAKAKFCSKCGAQQDDIFKNEVEEPQNLKETFDYLFNQGGSLKTVLTKDFIIKQFFSYEHRINRQDYFFKGIVLYIIGYICGTYIFDYRTNDFVKFIYSILYLVCVVSNITLIIRRCHDLDKSGWFSLLLCIPVINIFFCCYLTFVRGTIGPNKYGEDMVKD